MVRCVINVPSGTITGAFNILFAFSEPFGIIVEDIQVKTLEGDSLGDPRDTLRGSGNHYMLQCYVPPNTRGKSEIALEVPGLVVANPVIVEYDTVKVVKAEWGTPVVKGQTTEIPIAFDADLRHLRKRNFRLSPAVPYQIYHLDGGYRLSVRRSGGFSVAVMGNVVKTNGVEALIQESVLEV